MDRRCFQERRRLLDLLRFTKLPTTALFLFLRKFSTKVALLFSGVTIFTLDEATRSPC